MYSVCKMCVYLQYPQFYSGSCGGCTDHWIIPSSTHMCPRQDCAPPPSYSRPITGGLLPHRLCYTLQTVSGANTIIYESKIYRYVFVQAKNNVIQYMLSPLQGQGVVTFMVPCEFEISLSVVGDDVTLPWRLVSMNILVGSSLPGKPPNHNYRVVATPWFISTGSPVLVHEFQKVYLHQLIQSRLCADSAPLLDAYQCLHSFCLSLQLDCLHSQVPYCSCMHAWPAVLSGP